MRKSVLLIMCFALAVARVSAVHAQNYNTPMMEYLGYTQLYTQYGGNLADGSNVSVAQDEGAAYLDVADTVFNGKTLIETNSSSPSDTVTNGHATIVGSRFFGNATGFSYRSVAPNLGATSGGSSVQSYLSSEFLGAFLLEPGTAAPYGSDNNSRVASHTYVDSDYSLNTITRLDYLEQRDDFMQVVPNNFYGSLGDTMNSIVVVSSDGNTTTTDAIGTGTPYTAGRVDPTVTGPVPGSPSDAIGQVAGIVGLLVSEGILTHSDDSYINASTTAVSAPYNGNFTTYAKPGYTVYSGDTSEVVKAALMAGALRSAPADFTSPLSINGISNWGASGYLSANGLDTRWGAGMANAYNSYQIIHSGQQQSVEAGGMTIGANGFDYVPHFGGADGSTTTGTYVFNPTASGTFAISLVWNLDIAGGTDSFSDQATLYNLNLKLIDVTAGGTTVATSASLVDNTQNIYANISGGHQYEIEIGTTSAPFDWDYGLAWQEIPAPEPGPLVMLVFAGLLLVRRPPNAGRSAA